MKKLAEFITGVIGACLGIIAAIAVFHWFILPHLPGFSKGPGPQWSENPTAEEYIAHGYKWAEANRRIQDNDYIVGMYYRSEDPNIEVWLDLVEQEGWAFPVVQMSASEPNARIEVHQRLIANTSGGPILWPEHDPNELAKFLDKKITLHSVGSDCDISKDAPMTAR